jgi:hypothetical protein
MDGNNIFGLERSVGDAIPNLGITRAMKMPNVIQSKPKIADAIIPVMRFVITNAP